MNLNEPIGIRLTEPVTTKLKEIAEEKGSKLTPYMRIVLTEHANKHYGK